MSGYIKYFENRSKNILIKDDEVWAKHDEIWDAIKDELGIKFDSKPVFEQKYLKAKVREFDGVIKTNFLGNDMLKENMHYTCIACITIDSIVNIDKENHPQVGLKSDSDSDLDSEKVGTNVDNELMTKLILNKTFYSYSFSLKILRS